jgi:hypothetical protein
MYSKKLITPTQAEKVLQDNPKRWAQLNSEEFITQSEGAETLAAADDPGEEVVHVSVREQFEEVSDLV